MFVKYSFNVDTIVVMKRTKTLAKACESNSFHSVKVIQMKLDTHGPNVEYMCMTYFCKPMVSELCSVFELDIFPVSPYRERLCLKLLPQFSIDLISMCHTCTLRSVDVHNIIWVRHDQRVSELCPFWISFL